LREAPEPQYLAYVTVMRRITTFRSTTGRVNDGGPVIL